MQTKKKQSALDAFNELELEVEQRLAYVYEQVEDQCRDGIALGFDQHCLTFTVNPDTDTIEVNLLPKQALNLSNWKSAVAKFPWASLIGHSFGWGWIATNQQGYQDSVLLSFDGLDPNILLCVSASSIKVFSVSETSQE